MCFCLSGTAICDGDLFSSFNVSQSKEHHSSHAVSPHHRSIRRCAMIDSGGYQEYGYTGVSTYFDGYLKEEPRSRALEIAILNVRNEIAQSDVPF